MAQGAKVSRRALPRPKVLISEERIRARVAELGRQITRAYKGRELTLVCVLKGSFVFAADLARQINLPLTVDFVRMSSYGDRKESGGSVRLEFDVTQPIRGRHVIVVEDIVDSGRTLRALLDMFAPRKPASLAVSALLHKPARAVVHVPIDYLGFTIPDKFVVGYGLDHAGRFRNLPYVGALDP